MRHLRRTIGFASVGIALALFGATLLSAPAARAAEAATVTCKDGTTSPGGRGACSHHGGVAKAAAATAPAAAAPAPASQGGAAGTGAAAATVTCKDGTQSKAGRGACSHHGGIATAGAAAPAPAAAAPAKAAPPAASKPAAATSAKSDDATGATAKCKDGTYSHSQHHTGSCSHHGGVAEWLDGSSK